MERGSQPDLVRDTKLDIEVSDKRAIQVTYLSDSAKGWRRVRSEQVWEQKKELGSGSYGIVHLQKCIEGYNHGQLRAVKRLRKLDSTLASCHQELEAIAKFSQEKVE